MGRFAPTSCARSPSWKLGALSPKTPALAPVCPQHLSVEFAAKLGSATVAHPHDPELYIATDVPR